MFGREAMFGAEAVFVKRCRGGATFVGEATFEKGSDENPRPVFRLNLSHRKYSSMGFRRSTPPQNRQLIVYYYQLKYEVDGLV